MAVLIGTSVLGRLANRADASHAVAQAAVAELHRRGETLHVTAQNLIEFRNFGTRPVAANGLGLSAVAASALAASFESAFALLEETPAVDPAWRALADGLGVIGKQVHDARLVAICRIHGVCHVLTFNVGHFASGGVRTGGRKALSSAAPGKCGIRWTITASGCTPSAASPYRVPHAGRRPAGFPPLRSPCESEGSSSRGRPAWLSGACIPGAISRAFFWASAIVFSISEMFQYPTVSSLTLKNTPATMLVFDIAEPTPFAKVDWSSGVAAFAPAAALAGKIATVLVARTVAS